MIAVRGHIGEGGTPSDGIAEVQEVDDGVVTEEDFNGALTRVAEQQGLKEAPPPDDPQYDLFKDQAMSEVLLPLWIEGEAADRGITVTDQEITDRADQIVEQNFGSPKEFEKFVVEQGFCTEDEVADRRADRVPGRAARGARHDPCRADPGGDRRRQPRGRRREGPAG